jgi:hypothetical protein
MNGSFHAGAPRRAGKGAKKVHLLRCASSCIARRTHQVRLRSSALRALHLGLFDQPQNEHSTLVTGVSAEQNRIPKMAIMDE